jgi:hypothetical protein
MAKFIAELLHRLFREHVSAFWVGALGLLPLHFGILLAIDFHWDSVVLMLIAKSSGAIMLSFFTGLTTSLASDVYKHKLKNKVEKILKPKKDEDRNDKAA